MAQWLACLTRKCLSGDSSRPQCFREQEIVLSLIGTVWFQEQI